MRSGRHQGSQKSEYSDGCHVVRRIESVDMGEPGHEQWSYSAEQCVRDVVREGNAGTAERRRKRADHDAEPIGPRT